MKAYKCSNCGYESMVDDTMEFVCPKCGVKEKEFRRSENELDAIIDSVVEDILEERNSNIVNENEKQKYIEISEDNPLIIRNSEKCVNCGQCKKTCERIANIKYDMNICKNPICIECGSCVLNCPSNALSFKQNYKEIKRIIDLNEKIVVAIVDTSIYSELNEIINDEDKEKVMVGALSHLGFDYVFNDAFAKDLCIIEEVTEFAERLKSRKMLPMITSSCPSWISYAQIYHPELLTNISTCKSPIQMHSAIIKEYFTKEKGFDKSKIVTVSISNCTSVQNTKENELNVDYNMTISELMCLFKDEEININNVTKKDYDSLLSEGSGSAYISSMVGGESESFARTFCRIMKRTKLKSDEIDFKNLRDIDGIRETSIQIGEYKLRIAVVEGLKNLERLLDEDRYKSYHYIEVMNCIGGCYLGSGRLTNVNIDKNYFYNLDSNMSKRCSHDNKEIKNLYSNFLGKPMGEKSGETLRRSYYDNSEILNKR